MPKKTASTYEATDHLKDERDISLYLEAALEDGDTQVIQLALGNIVKARGMSCAAKEA